MNIFFKNHFSKKVTVEGEQILAFPSQDAICICTESDYQNYVNKFKVTFSF